MFDWDDLRYFLAAAKAGSFSAAALRSGVDTATVSRRVARLETSLKATLFVRSAGGLQVTSTGSRLLEAGLQAEAAMHAAARSGDPEAAGGAVRISVAEGFGAHVLAPALPAFRRSRPTLRIELAANAGFLSPTRREVDLAVTLSAPTDTRLLVEPLTDYQLAVYASPAYLAEVGPVDGAEDLRRCQIVGYVDDLLYSPELRYLDEVAPGLEAALSSSSIRAQREIILAGGGVGVLPCFLAEGLTRVAPRVLLHRRFWVSTLREVAATARVRAVRAWLQDLAITRGRDLRPFG
jgi:DNA-binding transcriptional LysR family regulator